MPTNQEVFAERCASALEEDRVGLLPIAPRSGSPRTKGVLRFVPWPEPASMGVSGLRR